MGDSTISCEQCQRIIVAAFDNEGLESDGALIRAHLEQCSECTAFERAVLSMRQALVSVAIPNAPVTIGHNVMRQIDVDNRIATLPTRRTHHNEPLSKRSYWLLWAGGLTCASLLALSWIACFVLAKEVASLREQLHSVKQDAVLVQKEEAEEEAIEHVQQTQQQAISSLHYRMRELERQMLRHPSPRHVSYLDEL